MFNIAGTPIHNNKNQRAKRVLPTGSEDLVKRGSHSVHYRLRYFSTDKGLDISDLEAMSGNKLDAKEALLSTGSKPSAPSLFYDPPPTYEESLNHSVVAGNYREASGYNSQQESINTQYEKGRDKSSENFKLAHPAVYPQQHVQHFHGSIPAGPPAYFQPPCYPGQNVQHFDWPMVPGPPAYFQPAFYPGQKVVVPNVFDEGTRFSAVSPPSIPPPPPGVAPNAAQLASQHGATVVVSKKKSSFLSGGNGAGFTFW